MSTLLIRSSHVFPRIVQWWDGGWKTGELDRDGDGNVTMMERLLFYNIVPVYAFLGLVLGLQIVQHLVTEMNSTTNTRSLTQHRKVAPSSN